MKFEIWDHDHVSADDYIAQVSFYLRDIMRDDETEKTIMQKFTDYPDEGWLEYKLYLEETCWVW